MTKTAADILRRSIERLQGVPMLVAAAIFTAGVLVFDHIDINRLLLWPLFAAGCAAAALRPRTAAGKAGICAALFLFGGIVWSIRTDRQTLPGNEPLLVEAEVADIPSERNGGRTSVPVRILAFDDGSGSRTADTRVVMWSDSTLNTAFGDIITAFAEVHPFPDPQSWYPKLMTRRGYAGTMFVTAADTLSVSREAGRRTIHRIAAERFGRLNLSPQAAATAGSMGAGDRSRMTPELREAYALSGVSHILAVSGLHVGIIFLLANILFRPLAILRHGQIIACAAVLVPVWLYAAAAGFPPSVVRAATMFSLFQLAKAFTASYLSLNILAFTAIIMIAADPDTIFDIGFQLSFTAVAAIITVGRPLFRLLHLRNIALRYLWDTFVIGIVAFTATAPLICHSFGRISAAGLILNPLVILCACIIVSVSVLWIAAPLAFMQPAVETVLNLTAGVQNRAVEALASFPQLSFELSLPTGATISIYLILALVLFIMAGLDCDKKPYR